MKFKTWEASELGIRNTISLGFSELVRFQRIDHNQLTDYYISQLHLWKVRSMPRSRLAWVRTEGCISCRSAGEKTREFATTRSMLNCEKTREFTTIISRIQCVFLSGFIRLPDFAQACNSHSALLVVNSRVLRASHFLPVANSRV